MISHREHMQDDVRIWTNCIETILQIELKSEKLSARIKEIKSYVESGKEKKTPEIIVPDIPIDDSYLYNSIRTLAKAIGVDEGVNADSGMQMGHKNDLELTKEYQTLHTLMSTIRMYAQYYALNKEATEREKRSPLRLPHD
ncbi:MAG: hypothetical protein AABW79_01885 [Nanoarchaeota archaeon]